MLVVMSRNFAASLAGLFALGLAAGCASSQMSRIDRNRDVYETWPIDVRQAVLDGKVEQGMTPQMVEVAWGKPTEVVSQGNSGDEVWVYKTGGDDGTTIYPGVGGGVYPGTGYPPGAGYPGGVYGGGGYPQPGIVVGTGGRMGGGIGVGVGGGGMGYPGGGMGAPIMTRPTPPDIREVVFRNGVVHRADNPTTP
jgi:hypothetical protein